MSVCTLAAMRMDVGRVQRTFQDQLTVTLLKAGLAEGEHVDVGVHAGGDADVAGQARAQVAHRAQQPLLRRRAERPRCGQLARVGAEAPASAPHP